MAIEHKIVVTRDMDGEIDLWSTDSKISLQIKKKTWIADFDSPFITDICTEGLAKRCLGFIPDKGTKEIITITRSRK